MNAQAIANSLPVLVGLSNIIAILTICALVFITMPGTQKTSLAKQLRLLFQENALRFSWIVAVTATLGSLFYSEVMHYNPCLLCWYQRILMYPLAIILGIAYFHDDKKIIKYVLPLSVGGIFMALYHYILQVAPKGTIPAPCSAVGYAESCTDTFVKSYGYITIPWMSFSAFVLITLFLAFLLVKKPRS